MRQSALWILKSAAYLIGAWLAWRWVGTATVAVVALAIAAEAFHERRPT